MKKTNQPSSPMQFIVSFVIPLIILTRFSSESQLGPTKSLLLALAFPVAFEIYSISKRKKISLFSVLAIGGILVTGAISLLGLSEGWLALRRSIPYISATVALLISIWIKHSILGVLLPQILDMEKITNAAKKKHTLSRLQKATTRAGYALSGVFLIIGVASYILTRIVIVSQTNTVGFNQEYAKLRLLSLPIITVPLLAGAVGVVVYLTQAIEKLTGLKSEDLFKKEKRT